MYILLRNFSKLIIFQNKIIIVDIIIDHILRIILYMYIGEWSYKRKYYRNY